MTLVYSVPLNCVADESLWELWVSAINVWECSDGPTGRGDIQTDEETKMAYEAMRAVREECKARGYTYMDMLNIRNRAEGMEDATYVEDWPNLDKEWND